MAINLWEYENPVKLYDNPVGGYVCVTQSINFQH